MIIKKRSTIVVNLLTSLVLSFEPIYWKIYQLYLHETHGDCLWWNCLRIFIRLLLNRRNRTEITILSESLWKTVPVFVGRKITTLILQQLKIDLYHLLAYSGVDLGQGEHILLIVVKQSIWHISHRFCFISILSRKVISEKIRDLKFNDDDQ